MYIMSLDQSSPLLEAVLESWALHNRVLVNLLRALPPGGLQAKATTTSPSVSQMLCHLHHERMVSVSEEAPEVSVRVPKVEWDTMADGNQIAQMLDESASAVRTAVEGRTLAARGLEQNFAHPIFLIQFLIFHEGYHHGQIKLALKIAGQPLTDAEARPLVWGAWRARS